MPTTTPRRALFVLALAVLTITAAAGPALAMVQQDYEVADGRTGGVEEGRENNDEQVFPINYTYRPTNHQPDASGAGFQVYASGLTENITGHWVVLESADFGFSNCSPTDASVFGIDRGNDDSGTTTDESLLQSYQSYTSTNGGIYIEFAKESSVTGNPIKAYTTDQIVAQQNNCVQNPSEPGWYRVNGHINGSTKHDAQTDYEIFAEAQYTYICDCDSRQQAREKLGPPPNEQSGDGGSGDGGSGGSTTTATATSTPTPTPSNGNGGGGSTTTATTSSGNGNTGSSPTSTATGTATSATATTAANTTGTTSTAGTATTGGSTPAQSTASPTDSGGPGFGTILAVLSIAAAGLVALRRKN